MGNRTASMPRSYAEQAGLIPHGTDRHNVIRFFPNGGVRMRAIAALLPLLVSAGLVSAQEYRAAVLGAVTDPSGAAVPKAAVVITNVESGVAARSETNL